MPSIICKLPNDNFLLWSTVVDAPVSYGMPREDFDAFMRDEEGGGHDPNRHAERMARAEKYGTSLRRPTSFEELVSFNRAGPGESSLPVDEIIEIYGEAPASQ